MRAPLLICSLLCFCGCDPRGGDGGRGTVVPPDLGGPAPDATPIVDAAPPPPDGAAFDPPRRLKIASYNVYNLFDLTDDPQVDEGEFTPGGQWNAQQFQARLEELARVLVALDADALAINEIESLAALEALRDAVQRAGGPYYPGAVVSPTRSGRGIRLGFLSRYPVVQSAGRPVNFEHECEGEDGPVVLDGSSPEARPIFQVAVDLVGDGEEDIVFLVNHWKARLPSFPCDDTEHRLRAARQLRDVVDTLVGEAPTRPLVLLGDFNAFEFEQPLRFALDAGLDPDAVERPADLYNTWGEAGVELFNQNSNGRNNATNSSYNFRGDWSRLDHILLTGNLHPERGEAAWRWVPESGGNLHADFMFDRDGHPMAWSFRTGRGFSDHLPVKVELELR